MPRELHLALHAQAPEVGAGPVVTLQGGPLATLSVPAHCQLAPLPRSFEEACERLAALPRLFLELDGSFFWTQKGPEASAIEGSLFDRDGRLLYVEMKGRFDRPRLEALRRCVAEERTPLMIQLMRQAIFADWKAFLDWLDATEAPWAST